MSWLLDITPKGTVRCLYTESIDVQVLGPLHVSRASTVEFDEAAQGWRVTLWDGTVLPGRFRSRSEALAAEVAHLQAHWDDVTRILKEVSDGDDA